MAEVRAGGRATERSRGHTAGTVLPARGPQLTAGTVVGIGLLGLAALVAAAGSAVADPRLPAAHDWLIVAILAVVGVACAAARLAWGPRPTDATPPWDVYTVWLMPAALLTPPSAFGALLVGTVIWGLASTVHPRSLRVVVACITVLTTVAIHACAVLIDSLALTVLLSLAAVWLIGALVAVAVAQVFVTPAGTVIWLDVRWSLIQIACTLTGAVLAGAMIADPWLGIAGIAPTLLASFALRWPELDRHALVDVKTLLPNARGWEERTRELIAAARMRGQSVTVMILDIDRFKDVNDVHGHLAGDQVLAELAEVLRTGVAPGDVVGRFGGEEFALSLFQLSQAESVRAAERLRRTVESQQHHLTRSLSGPRVEVPATGDGTQRPAATARPADASGRPSGSAARPARRGARPAPSAADPTGGDAAAQTCRITCTIGLASSIAFGYDMTDLLERADAALVHGKREGRNRVQLASAMPPGALARALRDGAAFGEETPGTGALLGVASWWALASRRYRRSGAADRSTSAGDRTRR